MKGDPALVLRKEFKGQPSLEVWIDCDPYTFSTTVTTGVIASTIALTGGIIDSFTTRFVTWDQYRFVKARAEVCCYGSTNPGLLSMWFADYSTTPTTALAQTANAIRFNASSIDRVHSLDYIPHDPLQQQWQTVSSGTAGIGYFKMFTNNADFGSSTVATPYCYVRLKVLVQFRGFA